MKVESVKLLNQNHPHSTPLNGESNSVGNNQKVTFGKSMYAAGDVASKIDKYMPTSVKFMQKLNGSRGEAQNTIINAIGTAIIAPIFIKYNFLSKTDEDTRTYTAWRQPISAVLAVVTQVGLTVGPFNRAADDMVNNGVLADDYNQTAFKSEKFLTKQVKKQHPEYSKEQIAAEVEAQMKAQRNKLVSGIRNNDSIEITRYKEKTPGKINAEIYGSAVKKTIEQLIEGEKEEKKRLESDKQTARIRRREFYRTHNAETLSYMDEIDEILKGNDLEAIKKALKEKAKGLKGSKEKEELRLITEEILGRASGRIPKDETSLFIEAMREKVTDVRQTAKKYNPTAMPNKEAVEAAVKQELSQRIAKVDQTIGFYERVQKAINEGKSIKEIEEMFKVEEKSNSRLAKKGIVFAEKVADVFKKQITRNIDCLKQISGLLLALAIAPLTCELLNILYPMFMDAVFPNLSKGKDDKAKQKLVEQANNNRNNSQVTALSNNGKEVK